MRERKTGGFTLLEILIVLFIAMLMLGMGIVGFAGRRSISLKADPILGVHINRKKQE